MTSLAALGASANSVAAFPAAIAETFVEVFGYSAVQSIDSREVIGMARDHEHAGARGTAL